VLKLSGRLLKFVDGLVSCRELERGRGLIEPVQYAMEVLASELALGRLCDLLVVASERDQRGGPGGSRCGPRYRVETQGALEIAPHCVLLIAA